MTAALLARPRTHSLRETLRQLNETHVHEVCADLINRRAAPKGRLLAARDRLLRLIALVRSSDAGALTLSEGAKLSNDILLEGVVANVIDVDPVLFSLLQWFEIEGNGLTHNRENALATAAAFTVGSTWTESTPTYTQTTSALKIYGGDADVDEYLQLSRSNVQDIQAVVVAGKAKALARRLSLDLVYGDTALDANAFDGIQKFITGTATAHQIHQGAGATGAALSLANLDALIDLVRPKPSLLMMPRTLRRRLSAYARGTGTNVLQTVEQFGFQVQVYNGIPVAINDFMTQTETIASGIFSASTGGATASILAMYLADPEEGGLSMAYNGGKSSSPIQVEDVGPLETRDARRIRVKSYVTPIFPNTLCVARIDGITDVAVVA